MVIQHFKKKFIEVLKTDQNMSESRCILTFIGIFLLDFSIAMKILKLLITIQLKLSEPGILLMDD